jgi:hypothetical protein
MTNKAMTISRFGRHAFGACAGIALLAGCGGSQTQFTPSGATQSDGLAQRNGAMTVHPDHSRSWMAPEAKRDTLLYISDVGTNDVYVYAYPTGVFLGALTGFNGPEGECVDKTGNVFIANYTASNILKYAHGGTSSIATLSDPGYLPGDCSVDPTTGNLAVTNYLTTGSGQGNVAIYKDAKGSPKAYYTAPFIHQMLFCGYDKGGNLFVDGEASGGAFAFAELPRGATSFKKISLNQHIEFPGAVQWDGTHMAVGDRNADVIYRFAIRGLNGKEVGSTPLIGSSNVNQFWIDGRKVVGSDPGAASVMFWNYPAGGSRTKTIGALDEPVGATISQGE